MKVSFLVTYYNQKQYVNKSLDSILAIEKDFEWEILVGDDGSTDGTIDIIKSYMERYPDKIFLNIMPREKGKAYSSVKRASENRLSLLERTTGDFFCILDGDDWYCDYTFVNEAIKAFKLYDDISIVAFGFKYVEDNKDGKCIILPEKFHNRNIDTRIYLEKFYIHAGACVYKKAFSKERISYIKTIGFYDDNDIVINALYYGNMYSINKIVYSYRQTGISVYTSMDNIEQAILNVQGYDVDLKLIDKKYENALIKRNAVSIIIMWLYKDNLKHIIGEKKYNIYLNECKYINDSLAYSLLKFESISQLGRKMARNKFFLAVKTRKKTFIKILREYLNYKLLNKFNR